jgi:hypothetical protein
MTEKEYIEREAVLKQMAEIKYDFSPTVRPMFDVFKHMMYQTPIADVVEVRHAAKADSAISKTGLMCTACHSDVDRDAVWCKYCGAKMDGKDDEGK